MIRIILCLCGMIFYYSTYAQSADRNYIHTRTFTNEAGSTYWDNIQYIDGLGNISEIIEKEASPQKRDIVQAFEYNPFGNISKSWLPVVFDNNKGAFVNKNKIKSQAATTYQQDNNPFLTAIYDNSPLSRITKEFGAGEVWAKNEKAVTTDYFTNDYTTRTALTIADSLVCGKYTIHNASKIEVKRTSNYPANSLYVIRQQDEEGNTTYIFKNNLGQTLLIRQINEREKYDTYFIYDIFNNLRVVLPPEASDRLLVTEGTNTYWTANDLTISQYAYLYEYDTLNRCIYKKLPGIDPVYYIYDENDRLIFSQDGVQRSQGFWEFQLPDSWGRNGLTGICSNEMDYLANPLENITVQARYVGGGSQLPHGYEVDGIVINKPYFILGANYYDTYSFLSLDDCPDLQYSTPPNSTYGSQDISKKSFGLLTGTYTGDPGNQNQIGIYSAFYYDDRYRVIQTKQANISGGINTEFIGVDFMGQVTKKMNSITVEGKTIVQVFNYTYDHSGRLLETTHQLGNGPVRSLSKNTYDELGRLSKVVKNGNNNFNDTYTYNIRSWITSIKNNKFNTNLDYMYNGNICSTEWQQNSLTKRYTYNYDNLSRLKSAEYSTGKPGKRSHSQAYSSAYGNTQTADNYSTSYNYDKHGNIKKLIRYGKIDAESSNNKYGIIDSLNITLNGNQITHYTYDSNGRLTADGSQGNRRIEYNFLNLPKTIDIKNSGYEAQNTYIYAADGTKHRVIYQWNSNEKEIFNQQEIVDYIDNLVYKNGILDKILLPGGYIQDDIYYFYTADHLGSNRIVVDENGQTIQENHYYPFGLTFDSRVKEDIHPYKYNGKELDSKHGLNLYDYSTRYYDPAIGRFTTIDPLAEKYYSISPYAYVANNPIRFIDPTGMNIRDPENERKKQEESLLVRMMMDIQKLFSIDINPRSASTFEASKQQMQKNAEQIQKTTEIINTTTDNISTFTPFGSIILAGAKYLAGQEITNEDWLFAGMELFPYLPAKESSKVVKNLVKIVEKDRNVMEFTAKIGNEVVNGVSNFAVKDGKLYLDALHLAGSERGKVGRAALWEMAKDLGRQHNATEVIIQGGKRTTGKYKGKVPSPITIIVD